MVSLVLSLSLPGVVIIDQIATTQNPRQREIIRIKASGVGVKVKTIQASKRERYFSRGGSRSQGSVEYVSIG